MPETASTFDGDVLITAVDPGVSVTVTKRNGGGLGITTEIWNTPLAGTGRLVLGGSFTVRIQ